MIRRIRQILVTGAQGFIGKTLVVRLGELPDSVTSTFSRDDNVAALPDLVAGADAVIHLAGENRPQDESAFWEVNHDLTLALCNAIRRENTSTGRKVPVVLASSIQAGLDNPYGRSKLAAEHAVQALANEIGNPAIIFRLPGVFGKWCRPNYNSVVATFCHNIARGLPIQVNNPAAELRLVYVDDVVTALINALDNPGTGFRTAQVNPEYIVTLGDLATQIEAFEAGRNALQIEKVGAGLSRALYATFVSFLPTDRFFYEIPQYADPRGVFVEVIKTPECGQFSYFSAAPGVTRGGHYHHTKIEKFLVVRGEALFRFRHILTNEVFEVRTSGAISQVVETIPGWSHDVTNVGDDEMIAMLWANEIFDKDRPDTISCKV